MAGPPPPRDRRDFEIAIICALRLEADCVQAIFDRFWEDEGKRYGQVEGDQNSYTTGVIGNHNVVLAYMPSMGPVDASGTAAYMRSSFPNIKLALIVGICGGVPFKPDGQEIILGDVVIGKSVVQYDFGRQYPGLFEQKHDIENALGRPSQQIRGFLHKLQTHRYQSRIDASMCRYLTEICEKLPKSKYPGRDADELYESTYQHKHHAQARSQACHQCSNADLSTCSDARKMTCSDLGCDKEKLVSRVRLSMPEEPEMPGKSEYLRQCIPQVHVSRIASGNKVMKWAEERDKVAKSIGVIAYEMEAAGVWEHFPSVLIKGVCDYADSHKSKLWQDYSAATAAACAKSFLKEWTFEERPDVQGAPRPIFHVPFDRLQMFVGRSNEIGILETRLFESDQCQRVAVLGLGGVGKSRIALELAHRTKAQRPEQSVFWVQATDIATYEKDLFEIGKMLRISGIEDNKADIKTLVSQRLSQESAGEWLMILDNADDETIWGLKGTLAEYLADSARGSILVTTRNRRVAANLVGKNIIELHEMAHVDGIEMLRSNLAKPEILTDLYATMSLLARLTYLPLAIAQAAAYITMNDNSIQQYLDILNDSEEEAVELLSEDFSADGRYKDATNPVLLTWLVSFEHIRNHDVLAADYLAYMSCLSETGIPHSLLPVAASKVKTNAAIGTIKAYMIIWERSDNQLLGVLYDMHPLVHLAIRCWLRRQDSLEYWMETAIKRMADLFPVYAHEDRNLRALYMPHAHVLCGTSFGADLMERYDLLEHMVDWLLIDSKYDESIALQSTIVHWREETLGKEDESTLRAYDGLGKAYRQSGDWAEAEKCHEQAFVGQRLKLGEDHPSTLESMTHLASTYRYQSRLQEAEQMYRQALARAERLLGAEDHFTIYTMSLLAKLYHDRQRWDDAERMHLQLSKTMDAVLGADHPQKLLNLANLAEVYKRQERLAESERLLVQVVESTKSAMGPEHRETLRRIADLADVYAAQRRWIEAEKLLMQVHEATQRLLGGTNMETLQTIRDLAYFYVKQQRWQEAEKHLVQAVQAMEMAQKTEHSTTQRCMSYLAFTYLNQGRLAEAEKLSKAVLDTSTRTLRVDHRNTAFTTGILASIYEVQGRLDEAEESLSQLVETTRRVRGKEDSHTLSYMGKLAQMYSQQERWDECKDLRVQILESRRRTSGERHPLTPIDMSNLAVALVSQGNNQQARGLLGQALSLSIEILGPQDPNTLGILENLQDIAADQLTTDEVAEFLRPYLEQMGLELDQAGTAEEDEREHRETTSDEDVITEHCLGHTLHCCCEPGLDDVD